MHSPKEIALVIFTILSIDDAHSGIKYHKIDFQNCGNFFEILLFILMKTRAPIRFFFFLRSNFKTNSEIIMIRFSFAIYSYLDFPEHQDSEWAL